MRIKVSSGNEAPIYQQIVNQVRYLVASGQLEPGDELLPIRSLAADLVINPNTVARAYMELERAGVVIKRHGAGTFVADRPPAMSAKHREMVLGKRLDALLAEARQLGVDREALIALLERRAAKMSYR